MRAFCFEKKIVVDMNYLNQLYTLIKFTESFVNFSFCGSNWSINQKYTGTRGALYLKAWCYASNSFRIIENVMEVNTNDTE